MMMKKNYLAMLIMFQVFSISSQNLYWADQFGGALAQTAALSITADVNGDVITAGIFYGNSSFGSDNFTSYGMSDGFISKLSSSGNLLWSKRVGGTDIDFLNHTITDASGNIYVCGYFSSPVFDADPGVGTTPSLVANSYQAIILKLDASGNFVWATSYGSSGTDRAWQMDFDEDGNLIIVGTFTGTVDFNPDNILVNNLTSAGPSGYILRLTPAGNFVSVVKLGNDVVAVDVASNGNVAVGGNFAGTMDLDPGPLTNNFTSTGSSNGFVCYLTNHDSLIWADPVYGSNQVLLKDIALDNNDDVILTGSFNNVIQMDPYNGLILNTTHGMADIFVIKYQGSNGGFSWGQQLGGSNDDIPRSISCDETGYIYYIADFADTIDVDPGSGVQQVISSGASDYFISRLRSSSGQMIWTQSFGSAGGEQSSCIYYQESGAIVSCGAFSGTIDFDPGPITSNLTASTMDAFVSKYSSCAPYELTLSATGCGSYTSPSGNYTWTTTGTYADTLYSETIGCDSIINCYITIINIDTTVTQTGGTFTSNQVGATYQWGDCIAQIPLPGETNQSYTPTVNGSYAVVISMSGCVDTTACYSMMNVGINETNNINFFLYPNPANNFINISSDIEIESYTITDLSGRIILKRDYLHTVSAQINISTLSSGTYIIEINTEKSRSIKKFIKD